MTIKKEHLINITLIICLVLILISDYRLSQFGRGFQFFKVGLPSGITINYDNLQGYKFLEEGFIHIVDERTIFEEDTIEAILAYEGTPNNVFIKCKTTAHEILYLNIHILESAKDEMRYEIISYNSKGDEDWIDISNKRRMDIVLTFRNILIALLLILFISKLVRLLGRLGIMKRT